MEALAAVKKSYLGFSAENVTNTCICFVSLLPNFYQPYACAKQKYTTSQQWLSQAPGSNTKIQNTKKTKKQSFSLMHHRLRWSFWVLEHRKKVLEQTSISCSFEPPQLRKRHNWYGYDPGFEQKKITYNLEDKVCQYFGKCLKKGGLIELRFVMTSDRVKFVPSVEIFPENNAISRIICVKLKDLHTPSVILH